MAFLDGRIRPNAHHIAWAETYVVLHSGTSGSTSADDDNLVEDAEKQKMLACVLVLGQSLVPWQYCTAGY